MARFVLVHGAFAGAWCWEPLAGELERAGHRVEAIDMPGSGEDHTPLAEVTLDAYAERICQALRSQPQRAILVGHSMGGVAITQAAVRCREQVALLVYVTAFMPRDGQSLLDLAWLPEGADDLVQANIVVEGDPPVATMPASAMREAVMANCTEEQLTWVNARVRPQPVAAFAMPVSIPSGSLDGLQRAYVYCSADRAIPPALQRRMMRENPCVGVVELETDHSPHLSATSQLAAALERFTRFAAGP